MARDKFGLDDVSNIEARFKDPFNKNNISFSDDPININGVVMGRPKSKTVTKKKAKSSASVKPKALPKKVKANSRTPGISPIEKIAQPSQAQSSTGGVVKVADPQTQAIKDQTQVTKDIEGARIKTRGIIAGLNFGLAVRNARSAYNSIDTAAQLNIIEARRLAGDALERGSQRALEAREEGVGAGGDALLSLAAQGQDVQGTGAQNVQGSLEDVGIFNGLQEETNAITEALGFDLEVVGIDFQLDQAEIEKDSTILSEGLNFAATIGTSFL